MKRAEYLENKKKWIGKDFTRNFNIENEYQKRFIHNYVNSSPSVSTLHYKFREVKKEKWVAKNDFL